LTSKATYHSKFKIYPHFTETKTSELEEHSNSAKLILEASLIICNEATMMPIFALKAIEKILQKVTRDNLPYGNKVSLLGGDFRQYLSVVRHGNKVKLVATTINTCQTWHSFHQIKLYQNMRTVAGSQELARSSN
jgi:hypothetical protein